MWSAIHARKPIAAAAAAVAATVFLVRLKAVLLSNPLKPVGAVAHAKVDAAVACANTTGPDAVSAAAAVVAAAH